MHDDAVAFVKRNMKLRTVIDEATGKRKDVPEYPVIAIREIVMNALVHCDYSIYMDNCPITIKMFSDRIEIENPGGLYVKTLGEYGADTRNPYLANALEIIGETENRYSGIPTIRNAMAAAHLKEPLFENVHVVFRVTLFNEIVADENFDELAQSVFEFCSVPRSRKAKIRDMSASRGTWRSDVFFIAFPAFIC